jgi:molybdopterin biosynthesis enzyme MoaB
VTVIRTGLLHIPSLDRAAGAALRRVLHATLPAAVVLQESYAAGQRHWIEETLRRWCDEEELDLVLTVGGTLPAPGPSSREIVPEATLAVLERLLPGLPEAMRAYAQEETPLALLDRGVAGIRGRSVILNLPHGAGAAVRFLEAVVEVLPAILAHLRDDPAAPTLADALGNATQTADIDLIDEAEDAPDTPEKTPRRGLNAEEFAAYLQRRREEGKGK